MNGFSSISNSLNGVTNINISGDLEANSIQYSSGKYFNNITSNIQDQINSLNTSTSNIITKQGITSNNINTINLQQGTIANTGNTVTNGYIYDLLGPITNSGGGVASLSNGYIYSLNNSITTNYTTLNNSITTNYTTLKTEADSALTIGSLALAEVNALALLLGISVIATATGYAASATQAGASAARDLDIQMLKDRTQNMLGTGPILNFFTSKYSIPLTTIYHDFTVTGDTSVQGLAVGGLVNTYDLISTGSTILVSSNTQYLKVLTVANSVIQRFRASTNLLNNLYDATITVTPNQDTLANQLFPNTNNNGIIDINANQINLNANIINIGNSGSKIFMLGEVMTQVIRTRR